MVFLYLPAVLTEFLVESAMIYAVIGVLFGVAFALRGAAAIDPVARHATRGFRLLVMPGAALLWPVLVLRWWRAAGGQVEVPGDRTERWQPAAEGLRTHALAAWMVLAPIVAAVLVVAILAAVGAGDRSRASGSRDAERLPAPAVRSPQP